MIKPLRDNVLFQFLNETETSLGKFKETTSFGLEIISKDADDSAKKARWGIVTNIGPEVKEVIQGDYIFIEPLMWTDFFKHEGMKYWKTDESKVLLISKEMPEIGIL